MSQGELVVGVDVGGTKVAAGLVDCEGNILDHIRVRMVSQGTAADGFAAVVSAIDTLFSTHPEHRENVAAIGICSPGPLDPVAGVVVNPPNLPCWRNFPLVEEISRVYRVPVRLDNDANAAALAEALWGTGSQYQTVFYATIGTGIGTGIVFDRKVYHGRTGAAGEGGHMSIDYHGPHCGCGKPGRIEVLAAGPAIGRRARAKLAEGNGPKSVMLELAGGNIEAVTPEIVARANGMGDVLAHTVLLETVDLLSLWLSNIVDLLDPDVLIIGGGAASLLLPFFDEIQTRMCGFCVNSRAREIPLLPARYGADTGVAGGAALCAHAAPPACVG